MKERLYYNSKSLFRLFDPHYWDCPGLLDYKKNTTMTYYDLIKQIYHRYQQYQNLQQTDVALFMDNQIEFIIHFFTLFLLKKKLFPLTLN